MLIVFLIRCDDFVIYYLPKAIEDQRVSRRDLMEVQAKEYILMTVY